MPIQTGVRDTIGAIISRPLATLLGLFGIIVLCTALPAYAITPISQSYLAADTIPIGSLVSLKDNTSDQIVPSTVEDAGNLFGVTINDGSSLLSISTSKGKQIQVATSGTVPVIVSDYNGTINQGDSITASPIAGVGMKATDNVRIIGLAQTDLRSGQKQTVKLKDGTQREVLLAQIPLLVNVSYFFKQPDKSIIPETVQKVIDGIAGKKVDTLPIIISGGIFIIMLIVVMSIIYTMIRSSIISIGRNPLSQSSVYRNLLQLSVLVLIILSAGIAAIYFILTKL
ncbi:MAG: rane protein of unknown function [Candidatus Saccharibacteria bacterium]|nr:rane protein of unknown function [Candidatus Saccharibacteria bacterium]